MKTLSVRVIPKASREKVVVEPDGGWKVYLHEAPDRGRANERLVEVIAKQLGVSKRQVQIVSGVRSRKKIVKVS